MLCQIPRLPTSMLQHFVLATLISALFVTIGCQAPKAKPKASTGPPPSIIPGTVSGATMIVHRSFHALSVRQESIKTSLAHSVIVGRAATGERVTVFLHPRGEKRVRVTIQSKPYNGQLERDLVRKIKAGG